MAIVETKTGSTASRVDRLLWSRGHRPVRISKYATGLAALHPELPTGVWRRTLRRHFDGADRLPSADRAHSADHPDPPDQPDQPDQRDTEPTRP
jgi:hypothetical protein